jgi:thioredoxin reductase (NADPH)
MKKVAVVIIGAGAAGLSCALYLKRAGVDFVLLEKGAPGGKLLTIAEIGNYPGLPQLSGAELAMDLLNSATRVGVEVGYGDVVSVSKENNTFTIKTSDEVYLAEAVVVATGLSNVPTIKGEKELFGRGVSYCATCDGPLYRKKIAALYGQGERALEEAAYLANLVGELYLICPDSAYQGSPSLLEPLQKKGNVHFLLNSKVSEIKGSGHVESIVVNATQELAVSVIFPLFGEKSASAFLSPLSSLKMEKGFIEVDETMSSSVPGLFAAGDIVKKKLRQVVTACSDGAIASSGVASYLRKLKEEKA